MPDTQWFERTAASLRARAPVDRVEQRPEKLIVEVGGRTIVLDPDRDDADRVALWSEVDVPAGMTSEAVVQTCEVITADHAVEDGCVLTYNPGAGYLALGRSTHVFELEHDPAEVIAIFLRVREAATVIEDIAEQLRQPIAGGPADTSPPASQPGAGQPRKRPVTGLMDWWAEQNGR